MTGTIAAVTIGQSPRDDVVPEMRSLAPGTTWIEAGALDGLDDAAIARLAPDAGDFPLVTRTSKGTAVVGEHAVRPALQAAVARVETDADLVIVLCTGELGIESRRPMLVPHQLLTAAVTSVRAPGPVVILTPHQAQVAAQERRWAARGVEASIVFASPYGSTDFAAAGRRARDTHASLVVLDCLGYTMGMKEMVAAASGLPTILVRSLLARVAAEVLG
jgi:protein AroM